jgi:hypothetical protein
MTQITYKTEISRTRRWAGIAWLFICGLTAAYFFAKGATVEPQSSPQVSLASESAAAPQAGAWRLKPIEQVKSGERVWAYDPKTQLWSPREVVRPLEHDYAGDLITLTVQGRRLEATGNHPFWVAGGSNLSDRPVAHDVPESERAAASSLSGRWVEARSLLPGDLLVVRSGQLATVEEVATRRTEQKVYNLQVADLHTYAVGQLGIAVHNKAVQTSPIERATSEPPRIVYRVIRADENPEIGLFAKDPSATYTVEGHILNGSRPGWASQYISTTADLDMAQSWAARSGNRIVAIDLTAVKGQVIDLSSQAGRLQYLRGVTARNFAASSSEVLIKGEVPQSAVRTLH